MTRIKISVTVLLLISTAGLCFADNTTQLAKENADLKDRVTILEKELAELKKIVMQQAKQTETRPGPELEPKADKQESHTPLKLTDADLLRISQLVKKQDEDKRPVRSSVDILLYGYLKFDAAYDDSRTDNGNYVKWVESESTNENDDQFNMTANQSRFGLLFSTPQDNGLKSSGRVEIDFFGGGAENKANPMMRHAYLKLDWPEERFNIIAGQTSDVISPLNPYTLNYSVAWWAGNIGYRRPQIRLTKTFALNSHADLKLEAALARTIGFSSSGFPDTPGDAGEDAGLPGFQARASTTLPLLGYKPATFGISGHWAREELDTNPGGGNRKFDSWSLNMDLTQPVYEWLTVKGELFTGENLSAYLGGIGQGVNTTTFREISSTGGWIAAGLGPWEKLNFNFGVSTEDVDSGDVNAGDRTLNRSIFGNVIYSINKNTQIGFELSQWHTERKGENDADAIRAQTSFIYKF
jgi:hypothetical protein